MDYEKGHQHLYTALGLVLAYVATINGDWWWVVGAGVFLYLAVHQYTKAIPNYATMGLVRIASGIALVTCIAILPKVFQSVPGSEAKLPNVEGLRATFRGIPSPKPSLPYAIEITVAVDEPIQPFGVALVANRPISEGMCRIRGVSMQVIECKPVTGKPNEFLVEVESPAVTPSEPLLVTLMADGPFKMLRIDRVVE